MGARYKIDAIKSNVAYIEASDQFNDQETLSYMLGMRSMARILAGEGAGVYKLIDKLITERRAS